MYCTDIYIDSDSLVGLTDPSLSSDILNDYSYIFGASHLILEDNEWTKEIFKDALKALNYEGEVGNEVSEKEINSAFLHDFRINFLNPDTKKLDDSG